MDGRGPRGRSRRPHQRLPLGRRNGSACVSGWAVAPSRRAGCSPDPSDHRSVLPRVGGPRPGAHRRNPVGGRHTRRNPARGTREETAGDSAAGTERPRAWAEGNRARRRAPHYQGRPLRQARLAHHRQRLRLRRRLSLAPLLRPRRRSRLLGGRDDDAVPGPPRHACSCRSRRTAASLRTLTGGVTTTRRRTSSGLGPIRPEPITRRSGRWRRPLARG